MGIRVADKAKHPIPFQYTDGPDPGLLPVRQGQGVAGHFLDDPSQTLRRDSTEKGINDQSTPRQNPINIPSSLRVG